MAQRILKFKLDHKEKLDTNSNGFRETKAILTRSGVFDYYEDGNLVRELRPDSEVFKKDSLKTLHFSPLTHDHIDFIDLDNFDRHAVGITGNDVRREGDNVVATVVITDKKEIESIEKKRNDGIDTELSCGYMCDHVETSGQHPKDGKYDKIQTNIIYNHVATVDKGRAGTAKLVMDSFKEKSIKKTKGDNKKMRFTKDAIKGKSFNMDSINEEIEDSSNGLVGKLSSKIDEAVTVITEQESKLDKAKVDYDTLKGKHDGLEKEIEKLKKDNEELNNPDSEKFNKMFSERNDILVVCSENEIKTDGLKLSELKELIIKKTDDSYSSEGQTDSYIKARFDAALAYLRKNKESKNDEKIISLKGHSLQKGDKEQESPKEKLDRQINEMILGKKKEVA